MDRQRRAATLSTSSTRVALFLVSVAVVATSLAGCKNSKELARQKAELTAALDAYNAQIVELQKHTVPLRARLDALPEDLPGLEPVRSDLYAVEEVLGVENGRGKWLAGELEKAFASGKKADIDAVRNAIPKGNDGIAQRMMKVTHELIPFERLVAQSRVFEELDAAQKAAGGRGGRKERPPGSPGSAPKH